MNVEQIAKVCHQANKAYCEAMADMSQKDWSDAPEWQRESAVKGVQFRIANPDAPESSQHDSWMADKIKSGWTHGPAKDEQLKTHPCIVPFGSLPAHQQSKDKLFQAVCDALIPLLEVEH